MSVDRPNFALVADTAGACPPTETLLVLSGRWALDYVLPQCSPGTDRPPGRARSALNATSLHLVSILPIIYV